MNVIPVTPPNVQNGSYTVSHPERGHFSLKLYTAKNGKLAGKRILAMLVGPDNISNYKGVAFWNDERKVANVWRRHRGPDSRMPIDGFHWQEKGWSSVEKKLALWADLAVRGDCTTEPGQPKGHWAAEGYKLMLSSRCCVCNKTLTDPESIRLGIGPVCGNRS